MKPTAADIKKELTFNLIVQVLEEKGLITEKELEDRLTNIVKLSSLDKDLQEQVISEIKHH
ncbi:hypothetical protein IEO70_13240 [Bacillus sp. AGMB 02131]|uniref:Uncharacterized protein n=1 Tax=Peribacillus faecalis TaxID=2772559 RepID=A0A927HB26_9BACI|nr:hypothetical protein [Peribacillus faecalis]MBD3109310.1 hypothetical protein [Peribacillus faecalis]